MKDNFSNLPQRELNVHWYLGNNDLDLRYHSLGIGGIHPDPPNDNIVKNTAKLKPGIIRIFLQEFFYVYKGKGEYDWSKLDAYMDAVHAMGADIMASICLKPNALYPVIDEKIWMPTDIKEWQELIRTLVLRYSKENKYVTHWAIANEQNIGELGGCPYLIECPDDYYEYYKFTAAPIYDVLPELMPDVKVGGSSHAGGGKTAAAYHARFAELCKRDDIPVDFVCYNCYTDSPQGHAADGRAIRDALNNVNPDIKLYMTEFNVGIDDGLSIEEKPYQSLVAASLAASILALHNDGCLDGSFQYHIYDQYCDFNLFAPWYAKARYMTRYWNDKINRVGLLDFDGNTRPQYYVYELLYKMTGTRATVHGAWGDLHATASKSENGTLNNFIVNYNGNDKKDIVTTVKFAEAPEGIYKMNVYRIDSITCAQMKASPMCDLPLSESRPVYMCPDFAYDVYTPADSVTLVQFVKTVK